MDIKDNVVAVIPGVKEPEKIIGHYVVLWREESKQAAKVESVDMEKSRLIYELISGPEKGERCSSRFDSSQAIEVFDEESVILAVLDA